MRIIINKEIDIPQCIKSPFGIVSTDFSFNLFSSRSIDSQHTTGNRLKNLFDEILISSKYTDGETLEMKRSKSNQRVCYNKIFQQLDHRR